MLFGDTLAVAIMEANRVSRQQYSMNHPAGAPLKATEAADHPPATQHRACSVKSMRKGPLYQNAPWIVRCSITHRPAMRCNTARTTALATPPAVVLGHTVSSMQSVNMQAESASA